MGKTIENSIRHGNHLPGTERYTRPEEIKSLSKYLKSGIKDRDSRLDLEKDNLAAPKDSSAEFKEITNLSENIEILQSNKEVNGLSEKILGLDNIKNEEELSDKIEYLNTTEINDLSSKKLDIERKEIQSLSDKVLDIISKDQDNLSDTVLEIESNKDNKLSDEILNLDPGSDIEELSNELLKINNSETNKLSDTKLILEGNEIEELTNVLIDLEKGEDSIKLNDTVLEISDTDSSIKDLSDKIEKLDNNDNDSITSLSDYKNILKDSREEVSIYTENKEILENKENEKITLSNNKQEISIDKSKSEINLSNKLELGPEINDLDSLSNLIDKIENNKELSKLLEQTLKLDNIKSIEDLSNYVEIGPKIDEKKLSEFLEKLYGRKDVSLSSYINVIKGYYINKLPDNKEILEVKDLEELSSVIYSILNNSVESLSDFISEIKTDKTVDLYNEIINLSKKEEIQKLSENKELIEDNKEQPILSDIVDKISKNDLEELSNKKIDIIGEPNPSLSEETIKISGEKEVDLSKTIIEEPTEKEVNLSDIIVEEPSEKEIELSNTIIKEPIEKEVNLSNTIIEEPSEKEVNLSDIIVEEPTEKEVNLSDIIVEKPSEKEVNLSDIVVEEPSEKEVNLSDLIIEEPAEKEVNLSNIIVEEPSEKEVNLSDLIIEEPAEKEVNLSNIIVEEPSEKEVDLSNIIVKEPTEKEVNLSDLIVEEPSEKEVNLSDIILKEPLEKEVNLSELIELSRVSESGSIEKTEDSFNKFSTFESDNLDWLKLSPEDKNKLSEVKELLSGLGPWGDKIDVYLTSILSGTTGNFIPESKTEAYKNIFAAIDLPEKDVISVPEYKAPDFIKSGVSGLIRSVAEKTVGKIGRGATKTRLINETLLLLTDARNLLEKATKSEPYRLPGNDAMGTLSGIVSKGVSSIGSALGSIGNMASGAKNKPYNRPEKDRDEWVAPGQTVQDNASRKKYTPVKGSFLSNLGNNLLDSVLGGDPSVSMAETRKWKDMVKYQNEPSKGHDGISDFGIAVTNRYLLTKKASESKTFDEFKEAVPRSPRITTPEKFTSTSNDRNYMTLDSNHVWEILLRPYAGDLNGNRTWLPNIAEIDLENKSAFNITTNYRCGWLPITGFELQSKKLTSKELSLFNGNIYYPIGMELTNELRITFADDSLKSMRRYFELASKTSVYMSNIHKGIGFGDPFLSSAESLADEAKNDPTAILEGRVNPSNYKNVSFLIDIFVMTPQFSTISRTQLLCLLKDFTFEAQGETDSSPTELAVSFSIVGEWPKGGLVNNINETQELTFNRPDTTPNFGQSVLNNLGGVLSSF